MADLRSPNQKAISQGLKFYWKRRKAGLWTPPVKPSKYRNKPTVVDGVRFASKAEAQRDYELHMLERAGKISNVKRQPRYPLYVEGKLITTYVADWCYQQVIDGEVVFITEDRKGVLTPAFKIKWALAKALYPEIEWRLS